MGVRMPPQDAPNRDSDAWSRLRHFVDKTKRSHDGGNRPALANCKGSSSNSAGSVYDDEDEGPITTRWAAG
jgi:hypothetical protein